MILEHCYLKSNEEHFQLLYINHLKFKIGEDRVNNKEDKLIKKVILKNLIMIKVMIFFGKPK